MRIVRRFLALLTVSLLLLAGPAWAFFSLSDAKNAMVDFLLEQLSTECQLRFNKVFLSSLIRRLQGGDS